MLVALDFSGDMMSYAYYDGQRMRLEYLQDTVGFRTKDLFQDRKIIKSLLYVVKDIIKHDIGETLKVTVIAIPSYCSYHDRERIKKAASECDINVMRLLVGTTAAVVFMNHMYNLTQKHFTVCSVYSDYAELVIAEIGNGVIEILSSSIFPYKEDSNIRNLDNVRKSLLSQVKQAYDDAGLTAENTGKNVFISCENCTGLVRDQFRETLKSYTDSELISFSNGAVMGALLCLMKLQGMEGIYQDYLLLDVAYKGISVAFGDEGEFKPVIPRFCKIPSRQMVDLMVSTETELRIYEGNFRNRMYDEIIGTHKVSEFLEGRIVNVVIDIDVTGKIEYSVLDDSEKEIIPSRRIPSHE